MDNVNISDGFWDTCSKNPKHKKFVSVLKFDEKKTATEISDRRGFGLYKNRLAIDGQTDSANRTTG